MTPEEKKLDLHNEIATIRNAAKPIAVLADDLALGLDSMFIEDHDIRWLTLHQQAILLYTEIRLMMEARTGEIHQQINSL